MSTKQGWVIVPMHRKQGFNHTCNRFKRLLLKEAFFISDICLIQYFTLTTMQEQTLHVIMLEDDSDDRLITNDVLSEANVELDIDFYSNSDSLFQALSHKIPNVILVDFNSTPENGLQVLKRLKQNIDLQHIPVIILSDSNLSHYRNACYREGASSFITKPSTLEETRKKITTFFSYWKEVAES